MICDGERVAQLLRILIDNALAHTPSGTTRRHRGAPRPTARRRAPVGPRQRARAFPRTRSAACSSRSTAPTARAAPGLGLAIARELAVHMNAHSRSCRLPGQTTFTLTLRARAGYDRTGTVDRPASTCEHQSRDGDGDLAPRSGARQAARAQPGAVHAERRARAMNDERRRLVLVSNRGPVTFQADGSVQRGTGGLVTALSGLASHREVIWIASAMSEYDAAASRRYGGRPFEVRSRPAVTTWCAWSSPRPDAYDRFYNIFANPMLWFIQHYLWDLSNAPDIRRNEIEAFEFGYNVVNEDLARAVVEEIADVERPGRDGSRLPPLHAARAGAPRPPRRLPAPLRPHPLDPAGRLARAADADPPGALRRPARERHHRLPHPGLPAQLPAVLPRAGRRRDRR